MYLVTILSCVNLNIVAELFHLFFPAQTVVIPLEKEDQEDQEDVNFVSERELEEMRVDPTPDQGKLSISFFALNIFQPL